MTRFDFKPIIRFSVLSGPELDRILIDDLSRQLASYLDQVALYGGGPAAHQPTGLINVPGVAQGVAIDPANLHSSFCKLEAQIEAANVSMDSYGVIVSPGTRKILRSTPSFPGGSVTTWAELRNPQSSLVWLRPEALAGSTAQSSGRARPVSRLNCPLIVIGALTVIDAPKASPPFFNGVNGAPTAISRVDFYPG